ncbi:MAG: hypothetical protein GXP25_22160 [Planctomycetes bacterium]|nr:hypothetical protein [Planctomycetota bacterium]
MARIYLPYLLSGFVSLIYQVCWYRYFVDRLGANNITFVLVLCGFIGGIGLGSLVSRRAAERIRSLYGGRDDLTLYGQIELTITATALGLFLFSGLPNHMVGSFPYTLRSNIYQPILTYQGLKAMSVGLCVFVPCFFMGITFPLLCATFKDREKFPARLYAFNTLGACSGVLVAEFVLIRYVGTTVAFCTALLINALIGAFFLKHGASFLELLLKKDDKSADENRGTQTAEVDRRDTTDTKPFAIQTAAACALLSGLLSGGLEADIMKRTLLWGENYKISFSFLVFWAILAIFLASLCIGKHRAWRFTIIKICFLAALVYHVVACYYHLDVRGVVLRFVTNELAPNFHIQRLLRTFFMGGFAIFPSYFCISLLLPHVCNHCQHDKRHLGVVYGVNTVAFCLGVLVFGWGASLVNPFYSMRAFIGIFAVCVMYLFTLREANAPRRILLAPALLAAVLVFVFAPKNFDKDFFRFTDVEKFGAKSVRSDGAHMIYVVDYPDRHRELYFDAHAMSGNNRRSLQYMKLMAHFPLLAHPKPEKALLICFGVGSTAKAIADHSTIQRLDAVDLTKPVFDLAPEFAATNNKVYEDKRVRLIHDDGRNFLDLTDQTYDLITSEPPPPSMPGVGRLYSIEYYRACRDRLSPNGLVSQWLPVYQMTEAMMDRLVNTFRAVFPETLLFVGFHEEMILVGSRAPIDLACIERRFAEDQTVLADMQSIGVTSPAHLLARIYLTDELIDQRFAGKGIVTDETNFLDYANFMTARERYDTLQGEKLRGNPYLQPKAGLIYDPGALVRDFQKFNLQCYPTLYETLKSLEAIHRLVPDFPIPLPRKTFPPRPGKEVRPSNRPAPSRLH